MRNALLLVGDTLGFVGVGRQEVFNLRCRLTLEGKFHILLLTFYNSHHVHLIHHLVEPGVREIGNGGVPCHLHLQLADWQTVVVKQHNQFACVRFIHLTVDVLLTIPADEVCPAWHTRPELDTEGRGPACIPVYGQHEV